MNTSPDTKTFGAGLHLQGCYDLGNFTLKPSIGVRVNRLETDAMTLGSINIDKTTQTFTELPIRLAVEAKGFENNGWLVKPEFSIKYAPVFGDKSIFVRRIEQEVFDTSPVDAHFGFQAIKGPWKIDANVIAGFGKNSTSSIGAKLGVLYSF